MTNSLAILVFTNCTFLVNLPTNTTHVCIGDGTTWTTNAWPSNCAKQIVGTMGTNEVRLFKVITKE